MFQKLAKSPELLKKLLVQNTLDEYYDFCTKIQDGYTKEELRIFFDDLSLLAKKLENSKIELDEELEQVCGGVDIKNSNRKFLSTFLSALTLSGTFSVGAIQNEEKTNRENVSAINSTYSRKVTNNQNEKENEKKNQKSKLSKTEKVLLGVFASAAAAGALALVVKNLSKSSNSENSNSNSFKLTNDSPLLPTGQFNAGLKNYLGETCFSNALLQQLYSIKSFRKFVDSINSSEDLQQYGIETIFKERNGLPGDKKLKEPEELKKLENFKNMLWDKINKFKTIFELMGTFKYVDENNMKEYVSTVLTGYPGGQQDISECYIKYLRDVKDLYQQFLIKDDEHVMTGNHCICCNALKLPNESTEWDAIFKFTFPGRLQLDKLRERISLNTKNFIDNYQQAYTNHYGYTDAALEISLASEDNFLQDLSSKANSMFMRKLVGHIATLQTKNLFQKYMLSTFYLQLKRTQLPFSFDEESQKARDKIAQQIKIYAAKAFSERQKLSETDLDCELNSIFGVLNKLNKDKNLKFGGITISDLEQISDDNVNTKLHNLIYNEAKELFDECYEKKIKPLGKEDVLSTLTKNDPDGDITPVDGQIAFFLNRTLTSGKSTVRIKLDSESSNGFEWDYRGKKYVLSAVSVHFGDSKEHGHYYTYKREADGNWYEYNDSSVYKRTWENIKDNIEQNGVMFTFTEKSVFEQSTVNSDSATTQFEHKRVCMAGIIDDYKVQSWGRRAPSRPLSLQVIKTGKDKSYTGITDQNLLKKLSGESDQIAIIDAANNDAQGGSGVDGAIFDAMGSPDGFTIDAVKAQIRNDFPVKQGSRIQPGECIIHDSFGIKVKSPCATHVIQAVGPCIDDKNSDKKNWEKELYSAYYNSFVLGLSNGIKRFITAPISLGIFCSVADPKKAKKVGERAANILLHAINDAAQFNKTGGNIKVYVTDHHGGKEPRNAAEDAFIQALYRYFPLSKGGSTAN